MSKQNWWTITVAPETPEAWHILSQSSLNLLPEDLGVRMREVGGVGIYRPRQAGCRYRGTKERTGHNAEFNPQQDRLLVC